MLLWKRSIIKGKKILTFVVEMEKSGTVTSESDGFERGWSGGVLKKGGKEREGRI